MRIHRCSKCRREQATRCDEDLLTEELTPVQRRERDLVRETSLLIAVGWTVDNNELVCPFCPAKEN